jgi:D-alanine-D-alanine ligase
MHIAILANLKKNAPTWEGMPPDQWDDLDSPKTIDTIMAAIKSGGHDVVFLEATITPPHNLIQSLEEYQPDLCFNLAEGHFGDSREAHIPAILEMLSIPYTGSKVMTLALALDKPMTKRILTYHDLPTPEFQTFGQYDDPIDEDLTTKDGELRFPMFVKPSREGTSVGITGANIVYTIEQLRDQVQMQIERYRQPILCERFIKGREITVGVIGNLQPSSARRINERTAPSILPETQFFFPPMEIDLESYGESEAGVYTSRIKVDLVDDFRWLCPAPLEPEFVDRLNLLTAAVFRVTGCLDVARVDFRLDEEDNNKPYILEVNPLPGLNPTYSDICIEANAAGWSYERLINTIIDLAAIRQGLKDGKVDLS